VSKDDERLYISKIKYEFGIHFARTPLLRSFLG